MNSMSRAAVLSEISNSVAMLVQFGYLPSYNSPKIFFIRSNAPHLTLFGIATAPCRAAALPEAGFSFSAFSISAFAHCP